ncbi:flagellar biosynthesis protein FliQ [Anaerocolumna xylanovorans]|uniref:Flagellar biosynthetic protein FliQ n=1 Tax=Anaerocolumna xylanovorans DSM 12503 TaxID=1121345 RepID=A0A1M7YB47_9FIRM|nr:flagellar biosynthesis protein FliQ [Anaerocolumna xylanovorans]SHO49847.1 flagellar biosynthetic protein FliQ [Anaerocolumna xylanovorans DSM 12503]
MNEDVVIDIIREALWIIIKVSAPMLLVSLIVGLIISILQTITSIQEQTLTFVPKFIAIFLIIMLFGGWIMSETRDFFVELINNLPYYIKSV